jgi:serine/threonine protein kinase
MSPEQFQNQAIDQRTDIWSLGVIFYEMLTGKMPFKGDYEAAVMYSVLNDEPPKITQLKPRLHQTLDSIVLRCLEKDKKYRYGNIDSLLIDLRQFQSGSNIIMNRTREQDSRKKKSGLNLFRIIVAIIAIVIVVLGSVYIVQRLKRDRDISTPSKFEWQNSIAVLPFEDLSPEKNQEYFCDGMTGYAV